MIRMSPARAFLCALPITTLLLIQPALAENFYLYTDVGESSNVDRYQVHPDGESGNGPRIGYGAGVEFQSGFGMELSKNKLGERYQEYWFYGDDGITYDRSFTEYDSIGLFATYRYRPEETGFFAGGRLGVHRWSRRAMFSSPSIDATYQDYLSDNDLAAGLELGYRWHPQWSAALTWTHYVVDEVDSDRLAVRVSYHFK
ncbi:hypothetical protein C7S18_07120 [Ahniella affigens]|uniref:Outer membrane protein beta-barrel domain-containing protein n=1 Tax=Ahniella affigens TaxID=2021234 RepID=A0A2P1PQ64_9GAMM|nr:outer membrane beta-barrel protein [Ahniella affigens]AVP96981.1 hypothetical protein C7S18_07120 [Ahniella affigens]